MKSSKHYQTAECAKHLLLLLISITLFFASCKKSELASPKSGTSNKSSALANISTQATNTSIPSAGNNKVAYYTFDATPTGNPAVKLSLLNFAKDANIVIIFEGSAWELADTAHYGSTSSIMLSGYYKNYRSILSDIKTLQSRGVKLLMNVDDANAWNTTTPFTTYNGIKQTYTQFAAFVNTCVTTQLGMDGISLDVEHMGSTAANTNFTNLLKEFGKYWGPMSTAATTTIYTAAIYDGAQAGYSIGQSTSVAQYMNFVMDMGYFEDNTQRFNRWANYIGASKTMIALSKDYNSLSSGIAAAQYQPTSGTKAGISVYAANVDSAYCNPVLRALNTNPTTTSGAIFYQDTQYGGTATTAIPKGNYTLSQLKPYGFTSKWASSVKLPSGWKITMYSGDSFSGTSWVLSASNADFTKLSPTANDIVTSVKIQ